LPKNLPIIILVIVLAIFAMMVGVYVSSQTSPPTKNELSVHFLNVGDGDCILILTPDQRTILVDAGDESTAKYVIRYLHRLDIERIDCVIITHPGSDDIGGLPEIIRQFGVSRVVDAGSRHGTKKYLDLLSNIKERRIDYLQIQEGQTLPISKDVSAEIVWPTQSYNGNLPSDDNESLALRLVYGENSFLLMGDVDPLAIGMLLSARQDLQSSVLGVPLHGDMDSTPNELLQVVQPDYCVISVGADDIFGAPAKSTLNRLEATGSRVLRTDRNGTIVFSSDGRHVRVNTEH